MPEQLTGWNALIQLDGANFTPVSDAAGRDEMKKAILIFLVLSASCIFGADFTTYYSDKSSKSVASLEFVKKLAEKYPDINLKISSHQENAETKKLKELIERFEMERAHLFCHRR